MQETGTEFDYKCPSEANSDEYFHELASFGADLLSFHHALFQKRASIQYTALSGNTRGVELKWTIFEMEPYENTKQKRKNESKKD